MANKIVNLYSTVFAKRNVSIIVHFNHEENNLKR